MGLGGEWDVNGVWMLGNGGDLQLHQHLLGRVLLLRKKRLQPQCPTPLRPPAFGPLLEGSSPPMWSGGSEDELVAEVEEVVGAEEAAAVGTPAGV